MSLTSDEIRENFHRDSKPATKVEPLFPLAEQTAIAADAIRECVGYLHELGEVYNRIVSTWDGWTEVEISHECHAIADSIKALTDSIAKIIDRLPVGAMRMETQ